MERAMSTVWLWVTGTEKAKTTGEDVELFTSMVSESAGEQGRDEDPAKCSPLMITGEWAGEPLSWILKMKTWLS